MASFLGSSAVRSALRLRAAAPARAAGGAAKQKRGKGGAGAGGAVALPVVPKEQRVHVTLGASILKDAKDPAVKEDSEYPAWLWRLLDKPQSLSELKRKDPESMSFPELRRFLKLDNRRTIKDNNLMRAKD